MRYRTGWEFELDVFGKSSRGLFERRFTERKPDFGEGVKAILQSSNEIHPPTKIGECLYRQTARQLEQQGIGSEDLVFRSSVGTGVDLYHFTDGFFALLSVPCFVFIDTFNTDSNLLLSLRETWIDTFEGQFYSNEDFQSDLFNYHEGLFAWRRAGGNVAELYSFGWGRTDFRGYTTRQDRPKNQLVLTPLHIGTYERRKEFARMSATYLATQARCRNTAQQSP